MNDIVREIDERFRRGFGMLTSTITLDEWTQLRARLVAAEDVCKAMTGLARYEIGGREAEGIMAKVEAWRVAQDGEREKGG